MLSISLGGGNVPFIAPTVQTSTSTNHSCAGVGGGRHGATANALRSALYATTPLAELTLTQPPLHADLVRGEDCVGTQAGLLCPLEVAVQTPGSPQTARR